MTDPFHDAKLLIAQARQQLDEIYIEIDNFVRSQSVRHRVDIDPATKVQLYRAIIEGPPLSSLSMPVKRVASDLRDALEHAVYAAACLIAGSEIRNTGFPIGINRQSVERALDKQKFFAKAPLLRAAILALSPYKNGNEVLWSLAQLRNANTHRFIVPLAAAVQRGNLVLGSGAVAGGSALGYSHWDKDRSEVEYMRLSPGSKITYTVDILIQVVFEKIDELQGKNVNTTLIQMADEVGRVVKIIEGVVSEGNGR